MKIKITYCAVWNYEPRAAGLADLIKKETGFTPTLEPGSNGIYDIKAGETLVYSKHKSGRFPENDEIITKIKTLES